MKYIINDKECGFLFKNGHLIKYLLAGKYNYSKRLGNTVVIEEMIGSANIIDTIPYELLKEYDFFQKKTVHFIIPDGHIGLVYINGALKMCLTKNEYTFWNVFDKYEIKLISMETPAISNNVTKYHFTFIPSSLYKKITIAEGEVGLLYINGKLEKQLHKGIYYYWLYNVDISVNIINLKLNELNVCGQEMLTSDKVSLRMNVSCSYKIINPVELVSKISNLETSLYTFIQLILREYVCRYRLDEILERKIEISKDIFEHIKEKSDEFFVEFTSIGIKDIILPGEISNIMNTVLIAEKTAQANVITRREEVASTRSLLNTAKLMDENKTLYKLKELEYLQKICEQVGNINIANGAGLIEQLQQLL